MQLLSLLTKKFQNLQNVRTKALENDDELLEFLLSQDEFKAKFFKRAKNAVIFKQDEFLKFLDSRLLDKSHTTYKNVLGLAQKFNKQLSLLKPNSSVVLNFPFKDCILKGAQSKEDEKNDEIFFNEILASDEIDVLKSPKVLWNFELINGGGIF